jgi:hypothetical protein
VVGTAECVFVEGSDELNIEVAGACGITGEFMKLDWEGEKTGAAGLNGRP